MSRRERKRFRIYDRQTPDYDILNSFDDELIEISSPPINVYAFNLRETVKDQVSPVDDLYVEVDIMDEDHLADLYSQGFDGEFDPQIVRDGEKFDPPVQVPGYYQEPTWTQELTRLGIENVEEELAITFNYQTMLSEMGKEIKIGDVIETFRGKKYRVLDAYVADEIIGWKYIHFHVICRKVPGVDRLILPDAKDTPQNHGGI